MFGEIIPILDVISANKKIKKKRTILKTLKYRKIY